VFQVPNGSEEHQAQFADVGDEDGDGEPLLGLDDGPVLDGKAVGEVEPWVGGGPVLGDPVVGEVEPWVGGALVRGDPDDGELELTDGTGPALEVGDDPDRSFTWSAAAAHQSLVRSQDMVTLLPVAAAVAPAEVPAPVSSL
jgi:hypothetical protein